jgi:hypothetical protein
MIHKRAAHLAAAGHGNMSRHRTPQGLAPRPAQHGSMTFHSAARFDFEVVICIHTRIHIFTHIDSMNTYILNVYRPGAAQKHSKHWGDGACRLIRPRGYIFCRVCHAPHLTDLAGTLTQRLPHLISPLVCRQLSQNPGPPRTSNRSVSQSASSCDGVRLPRSCRSGSSTACCARLQQQTQRFRRCFRNRHQGSAHRSWVQRSACCGAAEQPATSGVETPNDQYATVVPIGMK